MSTKKRASRGGSLPALRQPPTGGRPTNRLLAALPADDFRRVLPYLTTVPLRAKQVLHRSGEPIQFVYFPNGGIVSIETALLDGTRLAAAAIGNEGVVGGEAMLSVDAWSFGDSQIRVPDTDAERMSVEAFRHAVSEPGVFRDLVGRFLHTLIALLMHNATCPVRHDARQRCARWLLTMHDCMYGHEFLLSHESLAEMLGMRRPTVSAVAAGLQRLGLITYTHGRVSVLDRQGLEAVTCECYPLVRALFDSLRR
jgi:CRP-like cAMP-binding protein